MLFIIFKAHSGLRWLLVLAFAGLLVRLYQSYSGKAAFSARDETFLLVFTILFDIQVLLGLTMLVWEGLAYGFFPVYRIEHGTMLLIAALLAHLPRRWKTLDPQPRARKSLLAIGLSAALLVLGVAFLPQGW